MVRIGSTQKVITTTGANMCNKTISLRKCLQPKKDLKAFYDMLIINFKSFVKRKSVVHKTKLKKRQQQQLFKPE